MKALGVQKGIIGIEDNKPDAAAKLNANLKASDAIKTSGS